MNIPSRLINKVGRTIVYNSISSGDFDVATLSVSNTATDFILKAHIKNYKASEIVGLIQQGDKEIRISAKDLSISPALRDTITFNGGKYAIIAINTLGDRNEDILHILTVRGG